MLSHSNIAYAFFALQAEIDLTPDDIYLCSASIAFSSSRPQLMLPLSQGATVVMANDEQRRDSIAFFSLVKQQRITVIDVVPSFLRSCTTNLSSLDPEARNLLLDNQLRLIQTASEPMMSDLSQTWIHEFRHSAHHIHMYGLTETSGIVSTYRIPESQDASIRVVPIGRPILNSEILLLDSTGQSVTLGEAGEMYVSGDGVALGYLHDRELTEQQFVPHPSKHGARLYKTGDWGRYLQDGNLVHLGRHDQQVKIRGFRIELGEIEAVLLQYPGIKDAAVVVRDDVLGESRLVAYIVPEESNPELVDPIHRYLNTKLPDYMVPSYFVTLERLPTAPTGKVDRAAFLAPDFKGRLTMWRAPRTPEEEIICGLFGEVLGVEQVGLDDNFFELGGHSLLATQLVSRIRATLGMELAVSTLFDAPSVGQLSTLVWKGSKRRTPLEKHTRPNHLPLSHAQQRLWFVDRLHGTSAEYNVPKPWRLLGELDVPALKKAINTIVERHESLRTHFAEVAGEPIQVIEPMLPIEVTVEEIGVLKEGAQQERVMAAMRQEWEQPFDLARGPLLRMKLLKLSNREHILLRTMHHIVRDGWSEGIFNREFSLLYDAFREGHENPLAPLAVQYADYAIWQRKCLDEQAQEEGVAYWKEQLGL
jgi:acyl carrier protein